MGDLGNDIESLFTAVKSFKRAMGAWPLDWWVVEMGSTLL